MVPNFKTERQKFAEYALLPVYREIIQFLYAYKRAKKAGIGNL